MKYYKRRWNESRRDAFDHWGSSWWYFEADVQGRLFRQIEVYDNGKVLKYSQHVLEDEYGGLGDQELDLNNFQEYKISQEEFEIEWSRK